MKAVCISKEVNSSITVGKSYVIFAGKCRMNADNNREIMNICIQDDSGSIGFYDSSNFNILIQTFNKYSFTSKDQCDFMFDNISYDGFWSMFYNDSQERINDYIRAKKDFIQAKLCLYQEYSLDELRLNIMTDNMDERDFIFDFLKKERNTNFIQFAIQLIKQGMENGVKYYEVEEIFKYLASFKNKMVENFFLELIVEDVWENEKLNEIIYNYL